LAKLLDVFGFLSVLLRGLTLVCEALLVGGIGFQMLLIRSAPSGSQPDELARPVSFTTRVAATVLALTQLVFVGVNCLLLTGTTGLKLSEVIGANFAIAGLATVLVCILLTAYFCRQRHSVAVQAGFVLMIMLSSVATSHAWSRMDHRGFAAGITFLHHLAVGVWVGALPYLLISLRYSTSPERLTSVVRAFSATAMVTVAGVAITGASLTYLYTGSLAAFYGTSYGAMIGAKLLLMAGLLTIGAANLFIVRTVGRNPARELRRLRQLVKAEVGIGFTVFLAAASLVSQPPAIDLGQGRATKADIIQRFTPRWPRLTTPALAQLSPASEQVLAEEAKRNGTASSYVPGNSPLSTPDTPGDIAWSEYNHHWAGVIVVAVGLLAFASRAGKVKWARHWPLLFLGLAVFLFLRADPENWPLGPNGFWESFLVAEVLQHRFFMLLIVGFAVYEWRVQNARSSSAWMPYVFPGICALGGAVLLTHSHSLSNDKQATLIELSHILMAVFAVFAGWSRWLELQMEPESPKVLSWIWTVCFILIGSALLLYREA
jgi:putative copper resistance protein D